MASQTQGIQQLLAAEKKAAEKVAEARKRKQSATIPIGITDTQKLTFFHYRRYARRPVT